MSLVYKMLNFSCGLMSSRQLGAWGSNLSENLVVESLIQDKKA